MSPVRAIALLLTLISLTTLGQSNSRLNAIEDLKEGDRQFIMRNWPLAELAYSNAIQLDPDFGEAYMKRARLFKLLGRFQESTADFDRAHCLEPVHGTHF